MNFRSTVSFSLLQWCCLANIYIYVNAFLFFKVIEQNIVVSFPEAVRDNVVSNDFPIFRVPPIISGTGKCTKFKFCMHIYRLNPNKSPLKISRKVAVGVVRDSRKFSAHPWAHRAVIFAIAQLSCWTQQRLVALFTVTKATVKRVHTPDKFPQKMCTLSALCN